MNDTNPTSETVVIPEWMHCDRKDKAGEPLTALEQFVLDQEPAGIEEEIAFREGLAAVIAELMTKDQRTCPACIGTNGNHEHGCYLAPPSSNLISRLRQRLVVVPKPGTKPRPIQFQESYTLMLCGEHKAGDDAGLRHTPGGWVQESVFAVDPLCEEAAQALEHQPLETSCVHPADDLFYHGGITGNLSDYRCNLCQKVMSLPARAHRPAVEPTPSRERQLSAALGQWLHDFGSTNELSQRTRILLDIPHPASEKASPPLPAATP